MKITLTTSEYERLAQVLAETGSFEEFKNQIHNNKLLKATVGSEVTLEIDEVYVVRALELEKDYAPTIIFGAKAVANALKCYFVGAQKLVSNRIKEIKVAEASEEFEKKVGEANA